MVLVGSFKRLSVRFSRSEYFELVTFRHIHKEWNGVTDCLAKWAADFREGWSIEDRGQLSRELSQVLDQLVSHDKSMM